MQKKENPTIPFNELPIETQKMFRKLQAKSKVVDSYHKAHFGNTPPIVSVEAWGRRMVSIGSKIVRPDDPDYDWEEPADFLISYLQSTLDMSWLDNEINKQEGYQHEIAKWFVKGIPNLEKEGDKRWWKPNGKALALLHLAYDLYVLDNIGKLPETLINRLKINQNFNGARYEVFVFATLVRAGFDIQYKDERSGLEGRVPECKANHIESQVQIYVEAKTRNVRNVLGSKQGKRKKIRLYDKLKDAIEKNIDGPYVIFLDTNLPKLKAKKGDKLLEKVRFEYKKIETKYKNSMPNLVCVTNIPFHYARDDSSPDENMIGLLIPRYPKYKLSKTNQIVNSINSSLKKYKFLPKEFNEGENYADELLKGFDE
jgi:hypothetical protein